MSNESAPYWMISLDVVHFRNLHNFRGISIFFFVKYKTGNFFGMLLLIHLPHTYTSHRLLHVLVLLKPECTSNQLHATLKIS